MKKYFCECGREFDNPQKFNGHKQGCVIHIELKYGSVDEYYAFKNRNHDRGKKVHEASLQLKEQKLLNWVAEGHTCEKCGKVMVEKYGSGRFCCRSCANSKKHSEEDKKKISASLSNTMHKKNIKLLNEAEYNKHPKICPICGKPLSYSKRTNKTCSTDCAHKEQSKRMKEVVVNSGPHCTAIKTYKYGFYKGIECDSSWELAYVIYQLEHGINITRNKTPFKYFYNNESHNYFPDFYVGDTFVEIKGYYSKVVEAKVEQFPKELKLEIIDKVKIKPYIDYAVSKYGIEFWKVYDINKRSCNQI